MIISNPRYMCCWRNLFGRQRVLSSKGGTSKGIISEISSKIAYRFRDLEPPETLEWQLVDDDKVREKPPSQAEPSYEFDSGGLRHYFNTNESAPESLGQKIGSLKMTKRGVSGHASRGKEVESDPNPFVSWFSSQPLFSLRSKSSQGSSGKSTIREEALKSRGKHLTRSSHKAARRNTAPTKSGPKVSKMKSNRLDHL